MDPKLNDQVQVDDNLTVNFIGDSAQFTRFVSVVYGPLCNSTWVAHSLYLKNTHPTLTLVVTVEIRWVYQNEALCEVKEFTCPPNGGTVEMGCPIPGPTSQRFAYVPVCARPLGEPECKLPENYKLCEGRKCVC